MVKGRSWLGFSSNSYALRRAVGIRCARGFPITP